VFFELGVRLAVNPRPPICMLKAGGGRLSKSQEQLKALFSPIEYALEAGKLEPVRRELQRQYTGVMLQTEVAKAETIYAAVERNVSPEQEFGGASHEDRMLEEVKALLGSDLVLTARLPVPYSGNSRLEEQGWRRIVEQLTAAHMLVRKKLQWSDRSAEERGRLEVVRQQIDRRLEQIAQLQPGFQAYIKDA